jgi:ABC-type phosphate transport system auxiliary subunit
MAKSFDLQEFTGFINKRVGVITYFNQNSKSDKNKVMGKETQATIIDEMEKFQQRNSFYGEDFEDAIYEQMKEDGVGSEDILVALKMLQGMSMENTSYTKNRTGQELRKHEVSKIDSILDIFSKSDDIDHRHIKQLLDIIMSTNSLEHSDMIDIENKLEKLNLKNGKKDILWARDNVEKEAHQVEKSQEAEKVEKTEKTLTEEFEEALSGDKELKNSITLENLLDIIYKNDSNKHREFDKKEQRALEAAVNNLGLNYEHVVSQIKSGKKEYVKSQKTTKSKDHNRGNSRNVVRTLKKEH